MDNCKGFGVKELVKSRTLLEGEQKYKCRSCSSTYRSGDNRLNHSMEKRIRVIKMYLEGLGIRSIERIEGVLGVIIIYCVKL